MEWWLGTGTDCDIAVFWQWVTFWMAGSSQAVRWSWERSSRQVGAEAEQGCVQSGCTGASGQNSRKGRGEVYGCLESV